MPAKKMGKGKLETDMPGPPKKLKAKERKVNLKEEADLDPSLVVPAVDITNDTNKALDNLSDFVDIHLPDGEDGHGYNLHDGNELMQVDPLELAPTR